MAKSKKNEYLKHTCDECKFANVYDENPLNRDVYSKPTLLSCKYQEWRIVRHTQACYRFENKK